MTAPLPARLRAIVRTLRLPPAETPPDVTGHWYRQAADAIDEAIAELERLLDDDRERELPNPLAGTRATQRPIQYTICHDGGNATLPHEEAVWTDDESSFCPSCIPGAAMGEQA